MIEVKDDSEHKSPVRASSDTQQTVSLVVNDSSVHSDDGFDLKLTDS